MNNKHSTLKWNYGGIFSGMYVMFNLVDTGAIALVRMENSKTAAKRFFFDNLEFSLQMGLIPG